MKVLNVEHRDVYIQVEFSYKQLRQLRDFLSHASIEYNGEEEPEMAETAQYGTDLHKFLDQFVNNLENEG